MSIKADHKLDIKGEVCPFTFVLSKLKLEEIASGEILEIVTDHYEATLNVPRSIKNEGHQIVKEPVKINDTDWVFAIKKK